MRLCADDHSQEGTRVERSIGEILQIPSICLSEKMPILQAFSHDFRKMENITAAKQFYLFNI